MKALESGSRWTDNTRLVNTYRKGRVLVAKILDFDDVNRFIGEMTSGLSTRYDLGSELDDVGRLIGDKAIRHGDADVSLQEVMPDGLGVLLDASIQGKLSELVAATTKRIHFKQ